jgi:rfaE bifunctional protein kinase chain/domain
MTPDRFDAITRQYSRLRVGIVGDFCLDRYLEIDPAKAETSIETGLTVHNVVNVRSQPGGAGTILNNIAALGAAEIFPVGFAGEDGEGYELIRALEARRDVDLQYFVTTPQRRTFTYCKPLMMDKGKPPRELNRLDSKNWTATPTDVAAQLAASLQAIAARVDALILLDQVNLPGTGVVAKPVLETLVKAQRDHPKLPIIADSRRGLAEFPPFIFKMNKAELAQFGMNPAVSNAKEKALALARRNQQPVFVTMAEEGIIAAGPSGEIEHVVAFPVRGEIDIVGAGDAVTANLTCALAAGASLREALELANAAASVVVHQLGTTGTAEIVQLRALLIGAS